MVASVFYGLIVTPIEQMFTVESVITLILTITFPIWFIFFVTINRSRITNTLLAPIAVCFTPHIYITNLYQHFSKPKAR
jgi:hypothetical protein